MSKDLNDGRCTFLKSVLSFKFYHRLCKFRDKYIDQIIKHIQNNLNSFSIYLFLPVEWLPLVLLVPEDEIDSVHVGHVIMILLIDRWREVTRKWGSISGHGGNVARVQSWNYKRLWKLFDFTIANVYPSVSLSLQTPSLSELCKSLGL